MIETAVEETTCETAVEETTCDGDGGGRDYI